MKKSTIKRRKRVVPFLHDPSQISDASLHSVGTSTSPEMSPAILPDQQSPSPNPPTGDASMPDDQPREQFERLRVDTFPVDFTDYRVMLEDANDQNHQNQHQDSVKSKTSHTDANQTSPPRKGRKRSLSIAEGTHADLQVAAANTNRLSSISSILNPPQQQQQQHPTVDEDLPLDPNLPTSLPNGQPDPDANQQVLPSLQEEYEHQPPLSRHRQSSPDGQNPDSADDRRARLEREADDLREMLRAKERELQELG